MREVRYLKGRGLLRRPRYPAADLSQDIGFYSKSLRCYVPWDKVKADLIVPRYRMFDGSPPTVRARMRGES